MNNSFQSGVWELTRIGKTFFTSCARNVTGFCKLNLKAEDFCGMITRRKTSDGSSFLIAPGFAQALDIVSALKSWIVLGPWKSLQTLEFLTTMNFPGNSKNSYNPGYPLKTLKI